MATLEMARLMGASDCEDIVNFYTQYVYITVFNFDSPSSSTLLTFLKLG